VADIVNPKSQPCVFDKGWAGRCCKPSDNGTCTEHENANCVVCGGLAVRECDYTGSMPFVCGARLCAGCKHEPFNSEEVRFPKNHLSAADYASAIERALAVEGKKT